MHVTRPWWAALIAIGSCTLSLGAAAQPDPYDSSCNDALTAGVELQRAAKLEQARDALMSCMVADCSDGVRSQCGTTLGEVATALAKKKAAPPPAPAPPTADRAKVVACLASHALAQSLRKRAKLLNARQELRSCSAQHCPGIVRTDCVGWLEEVQKEVPSIVVAGADRDGDDTTDIQVYLDDQLVAEQLDGRALELDPGTHKLRFELDDAEPIRQTLVARQGERHRLITANFKVKRFRSFQEFSEGSMKNLIGSERLRFALNMFGDFSLAATSDDAASSEVSFALGPLGFLASADLYGKVQALSEFVLETTEEGPIVDLERLWLKVAPSESFYVIAGRMHTDLGFWNKAYHHGSWLQVSIDRPRVLSFEDEGGNLPVHSIGLELGTKVSWQEMGSFRGTLTIANGRGNNPDDIRVADDTNAAKSVALNLGYESHDKAFRAGISGLYDRIASAPVDIRPSLPNLSMNEIIANLYVVYLGDNLSAIVEGFDVVHTTKDDLWYTLAGFGLLSYRFGILSPYVRAEVLLPKGPGLDPFFVPDLQNPGPALVDDLFEGVGGLRIETTRWSALKLEYRYAQELDGDNRVHNGIANWAFGI